MNKGNLNKLVTNYPVELTEEEINNLSGTLAPVIAACGGGGGTGGKIYNGIGFVTVNNSTNQIGLTEAANTKLNQDIPTKVSDLSDSANYQTVAGMDDYLTTANAQTLYQTKEAMSAYAKKTELPDSITDFVDTSAVIYSYINPLTGDIQSQINTKQNKLQFDLNAKGEISAIGSLNNTTALAGANGITGDYYSASNPSGFINSTQAETQILEKHYLTKSSGDLLYVPIPEGLSDGQYYAMTTSSWKVIQGAGDVSGISTVAHDDTLTGNGNNENLGVDTTKIQTKLTDAQIQNITDVTTLKTASSTWDNVSAKLYTTVFNTYTATTAPATYQPKGDYLSSNALEGYATTALLDTISSKIENDIPTTVAELTDSGNYYQKTETSSKDELSAEFTKYVTSSNVTTQDTDYVMTTTGWKVLTLPGGGMTQVIHDETLTGQGNDANSKLGVAWSALSSNTIDYSNSAFNLTNGTYVSSFDQISAAIDSRYSKTASDNRYLQKSLDDTLTGDGTTNKKLGVAWSALSGNTIVSAEKAGEAQGFRWGDNTYQDTSAALTNLWNAKNHVTLQTANNILTVDNNDNTSATLSAMSYVNNTLNNRAFLPQKACVCLESEITTMATLANGQGMLFFVVSAH